jgi:hypothetical protein
VRCPHGHLTDPHFSATHNSDGMQTGGSQMLKNRKLWIPAAAILVILIGVLVNQWIDRGIPVDGIGSSKFPVSEKDARIYAVAEKYLSSQVTNDPEALRAVLSANHQKEWKDQSYLVQPEAFGRYDTIELVDLKMGIIDFKNVANIEYGVFIMTYRISFTKDGKVEATADLIEELGLGYYDGAWLIDLSRRSIVQNKQS